MYKNGGTAPTKIASLKTSLVNLVFTSQNIVFLKECLADFGEDMKELLKGGWEENEPLRTDLEKILHSPKIKASMRKKLQITLALVLYSIRWDRKNNLRLTFNILFFYAKSSSLEISSEVSWSGLSQKGETISKIKDGKNSFLCVYLFFFFKKKQAVKESREKYWSGGGEKKVALSMIVLLFFFWSSYVHLTEMVDFQKLSI